MRRRIGAKAWAWLLAFAGTAVLVAWQANSDRLPGHEQVSTGAKPTMATGQDLLAGITIVPVRTPSGDYRRDAFGEAWTDVTDAPGGGNGCDTRNDILNRDLTDKQYLATRRCPIAVARGTLHDPYSGSFIDFVRGETTSEAVQIDHLIPLALAWDFGAKSWDENRRVRFANDPANLLAVDGPSNQNKGDKAPAKWMPSMEGFHCQYSVQFAAVLRGYGLSIDEASARVLRAGAATCPPGG